jgi:hypothetical protein
MASKVIKTIEDLVHINQFRVTRDAGLRFMIVAKGTLSTEMKKAEEMLASPTDDECVAALKPIVAEAVDGLAKSRTQKLKDALITADVVFQKLLEDIQPVKEKLLTKDPSAWTQIFDAPSTELVAEESGGITLDIQSMSGKTLKLNCAATETVEGLKTLLQKRGAPPPRDQTMTVGATVLDNGLATLEELDVKDGSSIILLCTPYCEICAQTCLCADCHGEGRYGDGCKTCGNVRPDCSDCKGPCKCFSCHGKGRWGCDVCGIRPPCWGGDTFVLLPDGSTKQVRDCRVGDEVRTLRGSKRIARVWGRDPTLPQNIDTEVVLLDGVWITSHHPVIRGYEWVYPADFNASALWSKRRHVVPDLYNFELEGHDDTILLWGGGELVISCTIGKYLGLRFGNGICTRRSTRCQHDCAQCDAVYMEGLMHNRIPAELRWRRFPDFPQVEWTGDVSEFALAAAAKEHFVPPLLPSGCAFDVWLASSWCQSCGATEGAVAVA